MQDPSFRVPASLLPHIHLLSAYSFPIYQTITQDQVFEYLLKAPSIINDIRPVAWTFLAPPGDGTMFLAWQPQMRLGSRFASDGYVWGDQEQTYSMELRGYTMEVLIHRFGYRPGENVASHSRQRYRLVGKSPSTTGPDPDPSLWIVHYSQSDPQHHIPVMNLPMQPHTNAILQERRMVERQGHLVRKEFMFKDRANWPDVKFVHGPAMGPGMVPPGPMYPNQMMQQMPAGPSRAAAQYYQQAQGPMVAGPPAKRARQQPPAQLPGGTAPVNAMVEQDPALYDEHVAHQGDLLDNLTPKEISVLRYKQHHVWMDEILSSTFAAEKIQPLDLGLGLSGQLRQITDGLNTATPGPQTLEKDKSRVKDNHQLNLSADDAPLVPIPAYNKITREQLDSVQKRVDKFVEQGEREMEELRKKHARRVADMKRAHKFADAEAQLKQMFDDAMYDEEEAGAVGASPASGFGVMALNKVDDVVRAVEESLDVAIEEKRAVKCLQKGGLLEEEQMRYESKSELNGSKGTSELQAIGETGLDGADSRAIDETMGDALGDSMVDDAIGHGTMDGGDLTSGLLDEFMTSTPDASGNQENGSYQTAEVAAQPDAADTPNASTAPAHLPAPAQQEASAAPTPTEPQQKAEPSASGDESTPLQGEQDGMHLLNDMDLDVDMTGLEGEGASALAATAAESSEKKDDDWVLVQEPSPAAAQQVADTKDTNTSVPATTNASAPATTASELSAHTSAPAQVDTPTAAGLTSTTQVETQENNTPAMFDNHGSNDDFETFDGLNTAGDALADFTDLDGGVFGDNMGTPGQ
ncbi:DUF1750-domain-containing protein [Eremomyces bilateralis CBS 781.70]|uniref:DUF1750-domain-containing protein n=1 Tax=Eremomyces bilateralis CBS 781.70 TaxID=1392243 RepID=A0A6G1GF63_9PEZI|nr:DUF1750-domain-containing protein [Eremomyces bilateralis CBS 781.70]KAF1816708.1 DUF1750-domain-containing protein [Eremomyces bilateralis CBS 781.70]